ncbi:MAG: LPS export ABC transporter permease LptG, partial [Deltaproteobacteria bacterium]
LVIDFLENITRFTRGAGSPHYIPLFFICKIPEIISQVLPLGALMATMLSLGILSRNSEINAMRGSGISLKKITAPILVISFLLSIFSFFLNELVVAKTSQQTKYIQDVLIGGKTPSAFFRQNNIWYREQNLVLQAKMFNPSEKTLEGITIWQTEGGMLPTKRIEAEKCIWNGKSWLLKNVLVRDISGGNITNAVTLAQAPVLLDLKLGDLKVLDKDAVSIGFFRLKRYCENLRKRGYDPTRYLAQMHATISLPFASFIMAFLGIPFVFRSGRSSGIAFGIALSMAIGFSYFVINSILLSYGQTGVLSPFVSAWAANFIFAMSGIWLTMTVNE